MKVGKSSGGFIRLNKLLDHNVTFVVLRVSDIFCCISEMSSMLSGFPVLFLNSLNKNVPATFRNIHFLSYYN